MKKILSLVVALVMVMMVASALAVDSKDSNDIQSVTTTVEAASIEVIEEGTEEADKLIEKYKEAYAAGDATAALPEAVKSVLPEGYNNINDILTVKFENDTAAVSGEVKYEVNFTAPVDEGETVYVVFEKLDGSRADVFEAVGTATGSVEFTVKAEQIKAYGNDPFIMMVIGK